MTLPVCTLTKVVGDEFEILGGLNGNSTRLSVDMQGNG